MIYVGTFSKSLFPSLRLGYLLAPPPLVDTLRSIMNRLLHGVPTFVQAVVAEFIEEGHFSSHLRRMRRIYAERHDALCAAARRKLDGLLERRAEPERPAHDRPSARRAGGTRVADAARARDITVSPIGRLPLATTPACGLVLGFGGVRPPEIEAGVTVLRDVLGAQRPGGSTDGSNSGSPCRSRSSSQQGRDGDRGRAGGPEFSPKWTCTAARVAWQPAPA